MLRASLLNFVLRIFSSSSPSSSFPSSLAELLLDRLHLLVEVVFALRLLHLALDARADALLDLQHGDLALHQAQDLFKALGDRKDFERGLLVADLDREIRGDRVGELRIILDLADALHDLRRDLLVELDIALEVARDRTRQGFGLDLVADLLGQNFGPRLVEFVRARVLGDLGARQAFDEHLHGAVRQLEQLQHGRQHADRIDGIGRRVLGRGIDLGREQDDMLSLLHHLLQGADRLLAADEQRHDHMREDDDVPQRQNREFVAPPALGRVTLSAIAHAIDILVLSLPGTMRRTDVPNWRTPAAIRRN